MKWLISVRQFFRGLRLRFMRWTGRTCMNCQYGITGYCSHASRVGYEVLPDYVCPHWEASDVNFGGPPKLDDKWPSFGRTA